MLLLSRERPKINVYSQSSVVYISVYSVNHVLLLCSGEREVPIYVFSDQFIFQVSTMLPVVLEEVFIARDYPLSFPDLPTVQFLIVCSII